MSEIPRGGAEPFFLTWTSQAGGRAFEFGSDDGVWFRRNGERVFDFGSLSYQASLGHGHRQVIAAVKKQAEELCLSTPNGAYPAKREVAERLLALAPDGFDRVFFTLGGAEANENALKIARMFTGRYKAVSRYRSYHGATMGAVSLTGDWRRAAVEPGIIGAVHVDDSYCGQCPGTLRDRTCTHDPISWIPRALTLEGKDSVAAVFLEPVPGANGVLIPPPGYFAAVRKACDEHGALLVVDEVLTGFGRTGTCFGFEHFDDVTPDMITLGKALTAGYGTLGAVLVHKRVSAAFDKKVLAAGLTYYAHPLGMAAALSTLRVYEESGTFDWVKKREPAFLAGLRELAQGFPSVVATRGIGLLGVLQLDPSVSLSGLQAALVDQGVHGHVSGQCHGLILSPPLIVTDDELKEGFKRVRSALETLG